jgi:hypothetical protein
VTKINIECTMGEAAEIERIRKRRMKARLRDARWRRRDREERRRSEAWKAVLEQRRRKKQMRNNEPVSAAPPAKGWRMIAKRQFSAGGKVYPVGSAVPVEALGRNYQSFFSNHFVAWVPPSTKATAKPRALPPPEKPKPRPEVRLVLDSDDPVENWNASKKLMTKKCGGDAVLAADLLHGDAAGRDLFRLAVKVATAAEARRLGMVSVPAVRL